ncbi:MAG TPA: thioredoxin domain-containing protein [Acidobacteriaceae bacterium]|nr:thioredoxin domain-containing protein [Acidobacteriaceae bacterium]
MDEVLRGSQTASVEHENNAGEGQHDHANALASAASAYLRSAMHQPVRWMEWSEAAFERALNQDKPVLLDIGAVWCHWCHVMDRESYEDPATAQIINENFIAIKVDRDERPDIDTRYQAAVSAISGQGGWPLTAFLTPEGKPYFGGTYFPPEDRHGRPSFQRVLLTMAEAFNARRAEVNESAASVMNAIEHNESFSGRSANPTPELVEKMAIAALKSADLRHGGFGAQPKFPHSGAIDLLIDVAGRDSATQMKMNGGAVSVPEAARKVVEITLEKMAQGGIYDHLAGGFHRYSVDEHWTVPHFEKMAYDNSELLKNYVHAYQAFGNEEYARVARDIMRWMDEWLSDRERGGFYASQDADFSLDDDGDYFTWTRDEAGDVLTANELAIAAVYYDIGEIGDMHHNVRKNVLQITQPLSAVARKAGVSDDDARKMLDSAKNKLYAARLTRPTPYVDKTVYVAWDAMCISAYLEAARVLGIESARAFALKSLDRVLAEAWDENTGLAHVVAYGENAGTAARVAAGLDDYIFLGHAALDAWAATGELRYYMSASRLMATALDRFHDEAGDAFFDTERPAAGERRIGALATRRKPLQDSPTPAGNPMAAALLTRLSELNGRLDYAEKAQETLETFAGVVEHFGLYAATYGLALDRLVREPVQVCIVGSDANARALEEAALRGYAVNRTVIRLARIEAGCLPPVLDATLPRLPRVDGSFAVLCSHHACQPPVTSPDELATLLMRSLA